VTSAVSANPRLEDQELLPVRPLRVAVLVRSFPAISETFVLARMAGLLQRGHSVDIFAMRARAEEKTHQAIYDLQLLDRTFYASWPRTAFISVDKVVWHDAERTHSIPYGRYLFDVITSGRSAASVRLFHPDYPKGRKSRYDIILCFFGPSGLRGLELRKLGLDGKLVTTFGGFDLGSFCEARGDDAYDALFREGDLFLPVCDFFKKKLVALGCDESKVVVHRDGIDVTRFGRMMERSPGDGKIRLIVVSRLVEKKGVKYIIEAFANAVRKRANLALDIIGDGRERQSLQKLIDRLDVRDAVTLHGLKESTEVIGVLHRSDIAINASVVASDGDIDGIPNSLKEAMAAGLPVIASSIAGIPELVQDGVSGFLVSQADVPALTDRIIRLVDQPELRVAMGRRGKDFVARNYCIDVLMEREIELYQQLVSSS